MWQLAEAVDGMAEACVAFNAPVIGGNVSLYNETNSVDIAPTPVVGGIGMHPSLTTPPPSIGFPPNASLLVLGQVPDTDVSLAGRQWAWEIGGCKDGTLPTFDLQQAVRTSQFVAESVQKQQLLAIHDIAEGGLAVAAAEMAIDSGFGAQIVDHGDHISMFNESGGRFLAVVGDELLDDFLKDAKRHDVPAIQIGRTGGTSLNFGTEIIIPVSELETAYRTELPEALGLGTVNT